MSSILKLVLLGDHGVGKTCLVSRWSKNSYRTDQPATIGAAFSQREVQVNGETHKLQIWDTAGEERYHAMAPIYSQGAVGAFLVFDLTSKVTMEHLTKWQKCLESCDPHVCVTIVGNKSDCDNRELTFGDGEAFAQSLGYEYAEVSAKTGAGVEDAFMNLTEKAVGARTVSPKFEAQLTLESKAPAKKGDSACC
jgi:small GTP-binding protein